MRKLLFFAVISCMAACKTPYVVDAVRPGDTPADTIKISDTLAVKMQAKYITHLLAKRGHLAFTSFNRAQLMELLNKTTQENVDFFIGMYPGDYKDKAKRGQLAIILKIIPDSAGGKATPPPPIYYTSRICPPPDGCRLRLPPPGL